MGKSIEGEIKGLGLSTLLQAIHADSLSCTLHVLAGKRTGFIILFEGTPIAAETGNMLGDQAAYEMLTWDDPTIKLKENDDKVKPDVTQPLMSLMLDSQRIKDENEVQFSKVIHKIADQACTVTQSIDRKAIRQDLDNLGVPQNSVLASIIPNLLKDAIDPDKLIKSINKQYHRIRKPADKILLDKISRENPAPYLKYLIILLWIKVSGYKKIKKS